MSQQPEARLFYGFHYKYDELPPAIIDKMKDDTRGIIFSAMHIPDGDLARARKEIGDTWYGTFSVNFDGDLVLAGFFIECTGWKFEQFEMPNPEVLGLVIQTLRGLASTLGLPNHENKEPGWYLEANFG